MYYADVNAQGLEMLKKLVSAIALKSKEAELLKLQKEINELKNK